MVLCYAKGKLKANNDLPPVIVPLQKQVLLVARDGGYNRHKKVNSSPVKMSMSFARSVQPSSRVWPPSTQIVSPVTKLEASEAKNMVA
jgi:hypothetical protein